MQANIEWKCPYCGTMNVSSVEFQYPGVSQMFVESCEPDAGGCDEPSVLSSVATVRAMALAIEGVAASYEERSEGAIAAVANRRKSP